MSVLTSPVWRARLQSLGIPETRLPRVQHAKLPVPDYIWAYLPSDETPDPPADDAVFTKADIEKCIAATQALQRMEFPPLMYWVHQKLQACLSRTMIDLKKHFYKGITAMVPFGPKQAEQRKDLEQRALRSMASASLAMACNADSLAAVEYDLSRLQLLSAEEWQALDAVVAGGALSHDIVHILAMCMLLRVGIAAARMVREFTNCARSYRDTVARMYGKWAGPFMIVRAYRMTVESLQAITKTLPVTDKHTVDWQSTLDMLVSDETGASTVRMVMQLMADMALLQHRSVELLYVFDCAMQASAAAATPSPSPTAALNEADSVWPSPAFIARRQLIRRALLALRSPTARLALQQRAWKTTPAAAASNA